ncbi:MAG: hypothetical protein AAGE52_30095 [Myxococcota bacterium]
MHLPSGFEPQRYWSFENSEEFAVLSTHSGAADLRVYSLNPLRELSQHTIDDAEVPSNTIDVRSDGRVAYLRGPDLRIAVRPRFGAEPAELVAGHDGPLHMIEWIGDDLLVHRDEGSFLITGGDERRIWNQPWDGSTAIQIGSRLHLCSFVREDNTTILRSYDLGSGEAVDERHEGRVHLEGAHNERALLSREGQTLEGTTLRERFVYDASDGPRLFYPDLDEPYTLEWLVVAGHVVQIEWRDEALLLRRREDLAPESRQDP